MQTVEERKTKACTRACIKKEFVGKAGLREEGLAELLANGKAVRSFISVSKSQPKVGGRAGAKKRELEWGAKNDQAGWEVCLGI